MCLIVFLYCDFTACCRVNLQSLFSLVSAACCVLSSVPLDLMLDRSHKLPQDLRSTDTREQFKRTLKRWLYSSVYTAGGASDRRWLKACHTKWLTYLLIYWLLVVIHGDKFSGWFVTNCSLLELMLQWIIFLWIQKRDCVFLLSTCRKDHPASKCFFIASKFCSWILVCFLIFFSAKHVMYCFCAIKISF